MSGTLRAGDRVELEVDALGPAGEGVGSLGSRRLSVPGAFPGERVEARLEALSRQGPRAFGTLLRVLEPHPGRRESLCAASEQAGGRCGGCRLLTLEEPAQREAKVAMLREVHGLPVEGLTPPPAELGYRLSAKRVAFGGPGRIRFGSWQRGTRRPASMDGCLVDHPSLALAAARLAGALRDEGLRAHDARRGEGLVHGAWFKGDGERVLATLVTGPAAPAEAQALERVARALPELHGLAWSVKRDAGGDLRGEPATLLRGSARIALALGDEVLDVGPLGFVQPHPAAAHAMYEALVGGTARGELALDLYAGAGLTTRRLAQRFAEVRPCEANPEAAARLGVPAQRVGAFLERQLAAGAAPDLVVANPPRAGLGAEVTAALRQIDAPELRVLACGPAGLAKDLEALGAPEGPGVPYRLSSLRGFDPLPQTPHVELLAVLQRSSSTST